jgi:hypothetical protein
VAAKSLYIKLGDTDAYGGSKEMSMYQGFFRKAVYVSGMSFVISILMSGASQFAFAQLSCDSIWESHQGKYHCHVNVVKRDSDQEEMICTSGLRMEGLKSREACEQFCGGKSVDLQVKLADLYFRHAAKIQKENDALTETIKLAEAKLNRLQKIAGDACVKAALLESVLEELAEAQEKDQENAAETMEEDKGEDLSYYS